jgi:hypothetical protein
MKKSVFFYVIILATVFYGCALGQNAKLKAKYEKSKAQWEKLKKEHKNTYTYITTFTSGEGNFTMTNTIKVVKNKVVSVSSHFKSGTKDEKETTTQLTAKDIEEQKFKTIDEWYNFAVNEVFNKSTSNHDLFFETDSKGIISTCGYYPHGCMDDCFEGVEIISIKW